MRKEEHRLTDEELAAQGIEIPETETEAGFFKWLDDMINDVFSDVAPPQQEEKVKGNDDHVS